jgi:carbonic anhydrase
MSPFPQLLLSGYRNFASHRLEHEQERYRASPELGQAPEVMVIGCCDSRVPPEVIFDAKPGQLFVVRNVANMVPPYSPDGQAHGVSAALEYAVQALRVKDIVVLGHAQCGGVQAFAENAPPLSPSDFIGRWMAMLKPAAEGLDPRGTRTDAEYLTQLEQASLIQSLNNLMTFPWVRAQAETGELRLHAAYFGVATGTLWTWNPAIREFEAAAGDEA